MKRTLFSFVFLLILLMIPNQIVHAQDMTNQSDDLYFSESDLNDFTYSATKQEKVEAVLMNALDTLQTEINLYEYKISESEFNEICNRILDNNYRYFYVGSRGYFLVGGRVRDVTFYYKYDKETIDKMMKKYDSAISQALSGVEDHWSDMEKALYVNDYLALNCEYDYTLSNHTAYDALVNKKAVCEGYAKAYKVLLTELGIECEIVSSRSLNHAWNMVEIDGKKYHVDPTWNDPYEDKLGAASHRYFLKSTANFQTHHYRENDWKVTGGWSISSATSTTYDTYLWDDKTQAFFYSNGYWYAFDQDDLKKYQCNGKSFVEIGIEMERNDIWPVVGLEEGHTGYWNDAYHGLGSYGGYLYFSTSDTIYRYDTSKKTSDVIFELTDTQKKTGLIFGLQIGVDGTIYYYYNDTPVSGGTVEKVATKATGTKRYTIIFVGNGATSGSSYKMTNCQYEKTYKLTANKFKRSGYAFSGWNTKANGKGTTYKDKASVKELAKTNGGVVYLYAQWTKVGINTKSKTIYVGSSYTLKLTGTSIKKATSSNKKVATVSANGKVTAKKEGTATITLTGKNKKTYKCKITVKKPYINVTKKTLKVGKTFKLKLTGTTIKKAYSSNKKIATVSSDGKVKAKKKGTVIITLKGKDGKSYKCKFVIK